MNNASMVIPSSNSFGVALASSSVRIETLLKTQSPSGLIRSALFFRSKYDGAMQAAFGLAALCGGSLNLNRYRHQRIETFWRRLKNRITEAFIMDNIIPISSRTFRGTPSKSVDAETFYSFLSNGTGTRFNDWISRRIEHYEFVEGEDYLVEVRNTAGRPKKHYFLSLDMAKELAMVERNDQGKQARRYFIDCEKKLAKTLPQGELRLLTTIDPVNGFVVHKNLDNHSVIPTERFNKLNADMNTVGENLKELQRRMMIISGDVGENVFEQQLEELK